jgi:GNAT superfamily N-acetyltransferase
MSFVVIDVANNSHKHHADLICQMMQDAAKVRGTGIAKRQPVYIQQKMDEGKAIIALDAERVVGFCYIESWDNDKYVANSGLIVHPDYRGLGLAKKIKSETFKLSLKKFPMAKLFGITTSMAIMKINSDLGYYPVTFSELTQDDKFWDGCKSCANYDILQRTNKTMCICTGMSCDLKSISLATTEQFKIKSWNRFLRFTKSRINRIHGKKKKFPNLVKHLSNEEK